MILRKMVANAGVLRTGPITESELSTVPFSDIDHGPRLMHVVSKRRGPRCRARGQRSGNIPLLQICSTADDGPRNQRPDYWCQLPRGKDRFDPYDVFLLDVLLTNIVWYFCRASIPERILHFKVCN